MRIEVRRATGGYYFRIVSSNHQVLVTSEVYNQKASAVSTARTIQGQAGGSSLVDLT